MPIPPPPTTDASEQAPDPSTVNVPGAGSGSRGDAMKQWLVHFTGGGMPGVQQQIDQAHQQRLADAQLHAKTWKDLQTQYATNDGGKYWAKDAQGQPQPTEDGKQLLMQINTAQQAFKKVAGVNKESKSIIDKLGQVVSAVSHHGRDQAQAGGMPHPPAAAGPAGQSGAPPTSGIPTPPFIDPGVRLGQEQADAADARGLASYKAKGQADEDIKAQAAIAAPKQLHDGLVKAGLSDEEATKVVREKYSGIAGRPKSVMYSDPNDPTKKLFGTEIGGVVYDQQGESVANAGQVVPAMLPTATSTSSQYNADQGITTTQHTSQKVAPKAKSGLPAPGAASPPKAAAGPSKPSAPAKPGTGGRLAAMADDWEQNGVVPSAKDKPQVEKFLKDQGRNAPVALIPEAQKIIVNSAPVMEQIDGLLGDIKNLGLEKNNHLGYLTAARAKYAIGIASPEGTLGNDIAGLSLGSVVEAASVLKGTSRSVFALKKALEHTPNPWVDSPAIMKEKLETIKRRLKDVMDDAYKYGKKGAAVGYGDSHMPKPPQTADDEAAQYLKTH